MADVIDNLANRILELEDNRFIDVNEEETHEFVTSNKKRNTVKATDCHCRLFSSWLSARNEQRPLLDIPPEKLDTYLGQFFFSVRKVKKSAGDAADREYEPDTFKAMHASIHRYLIDNLYSANIKEDYFFKHSRDVLSAKVKQLKKLGKGNKPHAAQPFSSEDLSKLYEMKLLETGEFVDFIHELIDLIAAFVCFLLCSEIYVGVLNYLIANNKNDYCFTVRTV
jgi:hypothetical protein